MIFLTYWFVLFAAVVLPLIWLLPWPGVRLALVVAASAVFHTHFAGPAGVLPILVLGLMTYAIGAMRNRRLCALGIGVCVFALIFYKYTHFVAGELLGSANERLGRALLAVTQPLIPAGPPLAISFFTFEFVHYLYDVRAGSPPIRHPLHFVAFSIFWPSIVAGPVKRYQQFLPALQHGLSDVRGPEVAYGAARVGVGLGKKFVADNLTAYIGFWDKHFELASLTTRWGVVLALGARILLDFSGYSDMAIGFARMMGVRLPENFNWPYLATSMQDFWQRWHISLSSWIRDYVYVPLGGSRRGPVRRVLNGMIAFALCGLWHGAAGHFVAWGLYHGAGLAAASSYASLPGGIGSRLAELLARYPIVGWALTFVYVMLGWLAFFYPLARVGSMLRLLLGIG